MQKTTSSWKGLELQESNLAINQIFQNPAETQKSTGNGKWVKSFWSLSVISREMRDVMSRYEFVP